MTKTIKTVITFVITVVMFASMAVNAFAFTLTEAEIYEIAAMTPEQRVAKFAEIKAQRGGSLSVEDAKKIDAVAVAAKNAQQAKMNAQSNAQREKYNGLTISDPSLEWALPELDKAYTVGILFRDQYGNTSGETTDYSTNRTVGGITVTELLYRALYQKGYTDFGGTNVYYGSRAVGDFVTIANKYLYNHSIISHNTKGVYTQYDCYSIDDNVIYTRQDLAVLFARGANYTGLTDTGNTIIFNDSEKFTAGSDYDINEAKAAAQFMVNQGVMWTDNNNFDPDKEVTKFEAVITAVRLYNAIPQCINY